MGTAGVRQSPCHVEGNSESEDIIHAITYRLIHMVSCCVIGMTKERYDAQRLVCVALVKDWFPQHDPTQLPKLSCRNSEHVQNITTEKNWAAFVELS